jgi:ABC-type multidrug transport system ATPase subunit
MVSHRLSSIRDADLILVVQDGRIVEQGTHDDLLEQGGIYRQLHDAQTRQRRRRKAPTAAAIGSGHNGSAHAPDSPHGPDGEAAVEREDVEAGDFDVALHASHARAEAEASERALTAGDFDAMPDRAAPAPGTRNGDQ